MVLQPNIGSDRSWVWKTAADMSEGTPAAETLAVRFANSDSTYPLVHIYCSSSSLTLHLVRFPDAHQFKAAFEEAQKINAVGKAVVSSSEPAAFSGEAGPTKVDATDEANAEADPADVSAKEAEIAPEPAAKTDEAVAEEKKDA
jgi:Ran-binding protein 1